MRSDMVLLLDMLLAAQNVRQFTAGVLEDEFYNSALIQSAVVRELQVIGEAARLISEDTRRKYRKIEWRKIMGMRMRNRVIHEYFDIRADLVWDVVQNDIPELIEQLEYIVPPEE